MRIRTCCRCCNCPPAAVHRRRTCSSHWLACCPISWQPSPARHCTSAFVFSWSIPRRNCGRPFFNGSISSPELVLLIFTWPNDDVVELPRVHAQIPLWVTILVNGQLGRRKEDAIALILVLFVDSYFTRGQIEGLRLRTPVGFSESNPAIGNETDRPSCGSLDFVNVADVESQGARYRDMTHCLHFFKSVGQTVVLTMLKGLDKNLPVFRSGILEDHEPDREVLAHLGARAISLRIDRLSGIAGESCDSAHG